MLYFDKSFSGGTMVKNSAADAGDAGLILGLGRCPREGNGSTFHCWEGPWTEEPGRLWSIRSQKSGAGLSY